MHTVTPAWSVSLLQPVSYIYVPGASYMEHTTLQIIYYYSVVDIEDDQIYYEDTMTPAPSVSLLQPVSYTTPTRPLHHPV